MNERELWLAVINQQIIDATAKSICMAGNRKSEADMARRDARAWLLNSGRPFVQVCELAGVNPPALRTRARELAAGGWQPGQYTLLGGTAI